jgi:5'-AMP-activated protein kinase catalytic alpha subunit
MIANKKYSGLQVDVWSCGVILFAMVCGYLPFEDSNTSNLYKKILSGSYTLPAHISEDLKDLLSNILCVDPEKRYDVNKILSHRWCNVTGRSTVPQGLIVGFHRIPLDKQIVEQLKQYSFDL